VKLTEISLLIPEVDLLQLNNHPVNDNEIAEIALINPLLPQSLGEFLNLGEHPQTAGRKYPAPILQQSR